MQILSIVTLALVGLTVAQPAEFALQARSKSIKYKNEMPKKVTCPEREKVGNFGPYDKHEYTSNQQEAAYKSAGTLQSNGKTVGANSYPHKFGNGEKLPFPCGKVTYEFPLQTDGKVYNGGDAAAIPDRVVYEVQEKKDELILKYCGTMRHGPGRDFLKCD